jgi:protein-L-isoaspartate(D-aspartate) O-methyltransferase
MSPGKAFFMQNRKRMVETQILARGIHDKRVIKALSSVPRHAYVLKSQQRIAYNDFPLPIGYGQTISQPYIVALMSAALNLQAHEIVLEIGTGSGYQTAILSLLSQHVFSIELIPQLSRRAKQVNDAQGYGNISYLTADGSLGWPGPLRFDAIIITASVPFVPKSLFRQLTPQGRLILPVGERHQQTLQFWQVAEKKVSMRELCSVVFVPLKGEQGWR